MSQESDQDGSRVGDDVALPSRADSAAQTSSLVIRSQVPPGLKYGDYREYLRDDFVYSCAYCTIMEAEATAIRFTIDHYEPQSARSDLIDDYGNLLYACDECNRLKGSRCPPPAARAEGHRFFRPDHDERASHFKFNGLRVEGTTNEGRFSVEMIDLNRQSLRRLRDIRRRLHGCVPLIERGILALRAFPLDQLPPDIRGLAAQAIGRAGVVAEELAEKADAVLKNFARSPLIDEDPEAEERRQQRVALMKEKEALWPGLWTGARKPRQSKSSRRRRK